MPRKWYDGKLITVQQIGSQTRHFTLQLDDDEVFDYKPGQFITMDLPTGDKRLDRWRSYSIASPFTKNNCIDLCIVKLDGGRASSYLFDDVEIGETIKFKGPEGNFVLPDVIDRDIVLICTGTGVAPFRSMIIDALTNDRTNGHSIHLIFGTRYLKDVLYKEEFDTLQNQYPNQFKYSIALSREEDWSGVRGYVHQIYQEAYAKVRPDVLFYLCGWSQMVDEAKNTLVDYIGYPSSQVKVELYG